jgi:hypothetical protein
MLLSVRNATETLARRKLFESIKSVYYLLNEAGVEVALGFTQNWETGRRLPPRAYLRCP